MIKRHVHYRFLTVAARNSQVAPRPAKTELQSPDRKGGVGIAILALLTTIASAAVPCDQLATKDWGEPELKIESATRIASTATVPEHCDVRGTFFPEVKFAIKLPVKWNNRFQMVGGGGYTGVISFGPMDNALRLGYATASTDTGHDAAKEPVASFGYPGPNNPNAARKVIDYAYMAVHETAVLAKKIIAEHYGAAPKFSYWVGCSTGGRQGMMEAQRYPDDFDGYVIGAPVLELTSINVRGVWNAQAVLDGPGAVSPAKMNLVADAVLKKCDALDGVTDGLLEDPRRCGFDLKDLPRCATADEPTCFTEAQLSGLKKVYDGPRDSRGRRLYGGTPVGAERGGWTGSIVGTPNTGIRYGESFMQSFGLQPPPGPSWSFRQFDWDKDPPKLAQTAALVDAVNPDLSAAKKKGSRILHYHGWADALVTAYGSVDYYESVLKKMGAQQTKEFYRLFMVPGMGHCSGGAGCFQVDWLSPLVAWVENGRAPEVLVGTNPASKRTRPMCAYPETAMYKGSGSIESAENFACGPRAPALEFAFEARVDLGKVLEVGKVAQGERRVIPIVGGTFEGPGVKGRVLNGGADWQIVRADGFAELDARYTLETESGALIYVSNQGMRHGPPDVLAKIKAGEPVDPNSYYFRAAPKFETSAPELQWLARSIFVCTAERLANQVVLRFWRVL